MLPSLLGAAGGLALVIVSGLIDADERVSGSVTIGRATAPVSEKGRCAVKMSRQRMLCQALAVVALAFPLRVDWLPTPGNGDTLAAAGLTGPEERDVLTRLKATSFDVPDSWLAEVRVRRVSLGAKDGLLVRGTDRLCGATGNCQTWIFRRVDGRWFDAFESEAPIVSAVGLAKTSAPFRDLIVKANRSAEAESWTRFAFDGRYYRAVEWFDVRSDKARAVRCE
jgi:hypothetical protein